MCDFSFLSTFFAICRCLWNVWKQSNRIGRNHYVHCSSIIVAHSFHRRYSHRHTGKDSFILLLLQNNFSFRYLDENNFMLYEYEYIQHVCICAIDIFGKKWAKNYQNIAQLMNKIENINFRFRQTQSNMDYTSTSIM